MSGLGTNSQTIIIRESLSEDVKHKYVVFVKRRESH